MRASCMRSSSRILRTLRRLNRTAVASSKSFSKNGLIFFCQLGLYLTEHFLVIGAALLHFVGIGFENDADLIVDTVLKRKFFEQSGVHLLVKSRHRLSLDETAR